MSGNEIAKMKVVSGRRQKGDGGFSLRISAILSTPVRKNGRD